MTSRLRLVSTLCASLVVTLAFSSLAFAEPRLFGQPVHAPEPVQSTTTPTENTSSTTGSSDTSTTTTNDSETTATQADPILATGSGMKATASVPEQLTSSQIPVCKQRSNLINAIMVRADSRSNNQIVFFESIAYRVESFYVSSGKTLDTYSQQVTAINNAQTQAQDDLTTLLADSTFSCDANNPIGIVGQYRSGLTVEETDIQNLDNAVKNLIEGVAQAEGYALPASTTGDGQ